MGNNISPEHVLFWPFSPSSDLPSHLSHCSLYPESVPQTVTIKGPAIRCIVAVSNAKFILNEEDHLVTILGNNNNIKVNGSGIKIRVEGDENNINGPGRQLKIYSDSAKLIVSMSDVNGPLQIERLDAVDAPVIKLDLPLEKPETSLQKCIRWVYAGAKGGGGGSKPKNSDEERMDEDQDVSDLDDAFDEDNVDGNKPGETPNVKENPTRKRTEEDDTQDQKLKVETPKKLKVETPKKINRRKK